MDNKIINQIKKKKNRIFSRFLYNLVYNLGAWES
jgi:hypothetical protein